MRQLEEADVALSEALVDDAIQEALARARSLTPKAVERIEKGLGITHVNKAISVPQGDGMSAVEIVEVPDDLAAAEIALKFLRYIQEFSPKAQLELVGTLEARLAALGDGPSD